MKSRYKRVSSYARTMQPESVAKLATYVYIDRELLLKLVNTGIASENADKLRAHIALNMNPGYDISSPLEAYDDLVISLAQYLVESNMELIEEEIKKAQTEMLGIDTELLEIESPAVQVEDEKKLETLVPETPETAELERIGVKKERIKETKIPQMVSVKGREGGKAYERHKAVAWRKRKQTHLSPQEQFVYARRDQPVEVTQREYIEQFNVYRTKRSILVKQKRLTSGMRLNSKKEESGPSTFVQ